MENNWMVLLQQNQLSKIIETNKVTQQYGLVLSEQDAQLILEERNRTLREQKRVELGQGILPEIICEFCDSDFINQGNYVETIIRLQDIADFTRLGDMASMRPLTKWTDGIMRCIWKH